MSVLDIGHPIQYAKGNREETLLVTFDGFIKNTSEGLVRTLLRDEEDWIDRYPNLAVFSDYTQDVLYENTMIFTPMDLLYTLSNGKLTDEEIIRDLNHIIPVVFLENSRITSFEFALYNLMKERFVKKVYLYRETPFFENEFRYVEQEFSQVIEKIEWINGGLLTAVEELKPTTLFTNDYAFVQTMVDLNYSEWEDLMVFLLNGNHNMRVRESNQSLVYTDEFIPFLKKVNESCTFGVAPMFNQILITEEMEESENAEKEDE